MSSCRDCAILSLNEIFGLSESSALDAEIFCDEPTNAELRLEGAVIRNGSSSRARSLGALLSDTFFPFKPLSMPRSTFFGEWTSSGALIRFCGEAAICTSRVACPLYPTDLEVCACVSTDGGRFSFVALRPSDRPSFSTSELEPTAALRFCCSFLSLSFASNACNCSCNVSSSSSSSSVSWPGFCGLALRLIEFRWGEAADLFSGDGEGDVLSWYCRSLSRPLGELRRASCGERGGHRGSRGTIEVFSMH